MTRDNLESPRGARPLRGSLRSSLRCGACVTGRAKLSRARGAWRRERRASRTWPRPFSPPGRRGSTGCPWWTERASGGRRCPDDVSTAANVVSEARSESRRPERREGFREHYFRPLSATTNRSIHTLYWPIQSSQVASVRRGAPLTAGRAPHRRIVTAGGIRRPRGS